MRSKSAASCFPGLEIVSDVWDYIDGSAIERLTYQACLPSPNWRVLGVDPESL